MAGHYLKRKKRNWWLTTILLVLGAACVFLAGVWISTLNVAEETAIPAQTQPSTEIPTTEQTQPSTETEVPTIEQTQPTEVEPADETVEETVEETTEMPVMLQQPAELTKLLENRGIGYEELEQSGCSQLITVVSNGTTAKIHFYSREADVWEELPELNCDGRVGRSGVSVDKQEGDGSTPSGLFGIGSAFYIANQPDTGLDLFQITDQTYWVDDPNSAFYNQRVEGTQNKDWNSAEYMISYDVYRYGFVVDYNPQAVKGAGSAIFFHIGDTPTAGCIATGENIVLAYLKELTKERNPHILIVSGDGA